MAQAIVPKLIACRVKKIIIYSRGEFAQVEMERKLPNPEYPMRYLLGDVRDRDRLYRAISDVDYIIHTAAIKHVDKAQYNPFETVQTNVIGAQNVIDAAIDRNVMKVLAISTDKSVDPVNLYGASKLCSDFMFVDANVYSPKGTKFSVIRFGNFWGSSGSFVELVLKLRRRKEKKIPITHPWMTRFFIQLDDAADFVIKYLEEMKGGEIIVPKMKAYKIVDLARDLYPEAEHEIVGIREGEKMHEDLIGKDHRNIESRKDCYIIQPSWVKCEKQKVMFCYSSKEALNENKP